MAKSPTGGVFAILSASGLTGRSNLSYHSHIWTLGYTLHYHKENLQYIRHVCNIDDLEDVYPVALKMAKTGVLAILSATGSADLSHFSHLKP